MRTTDEVKFIVLEELSEHVCPEEIADATFLVLVPAFLVVDWVRPQDIAEHALAGDVCWSVQGEDLSDFVEFGTDSSMHAEYLLLDDGCDGHGVEAVSEAFPEFDRVLPFACVESIVHSS